MKYYNPNDYPFTVLYRITYYIKGRYMVYAGERKIHKRNIFLKDIESAKIVANKIILDNISTDGEIIKDSITISKYINEVGDIGTINF